MTFGRVDILKNRQAKSSGFSRTCLRQTNKIGLAFQQGWNAFFLDLRWKDNSQFFDRFNEAFFMPNTSNMLMINIKLTEKYIAILAPIPAICHQ